MSDVSCKQAELLAADVEMGRASEAQRMRVEVHLQRCDGCAERTERVRSLAAALRTEPVEVRVSDRSLVASALMEAHSTPTARRGGAHVAPLLAAAAALLALGLGAWWALSHGEPAPMVDRGSPSAPSVPLPREEIPAPVELAGLSHPCEGVVTQANAAGRAHLVRSEGRVCRIRLDAGELRLSVDPDIGVDLLVATPTANVKVVGTVFSVAVDHSYTSVVVYRGTVEVRRDAETLRITGGHQVGLGTGSEAVVEAASDDALAPLERLADEPTSAEGARSETETETETETEAAETVARREPRAEPEPEPEAGAPEPETPEAVTRAEQEQADDTSLRVMRDLLNSGRPAEARNAAQLRIEEQQDPPARRGELYTVIAESFVAEREWRRAFHYYRLVDREAPGTATAGNALFAAASLALDKLHDPRLAEQLYREYLARFSRGPLHDAALIRRCEALMAAGRRRDAQSCARAYLATHAAGDSDYRARAQRLVGDDTP